MPSSARLGARLGAGSYGVVYRGIDEVSGRVAVKKVALSAGSPGLDVSSLRELILHASLRGVPGVCPLLRASFDARALELTLVFPEAVCDARALIVAAAADARGAPLHPGHLRQMSWQLLRALAALHGAGVAHRDIKPENVLVDCTGALTLCDLGLSRLAAEGAAAATPEVVSLWYRAPETVLGGAYDARALDVWSLGVTLAELAALSPLFPATCEVDLMRRIFRARGSPPAGSGLRARPHFSAAFPRWPPRALALPGVAPGAVALLASLLEIEPERRLSAAQALRHPFFDASPERAPAPGVEAGEGEGAATAAAAGDAAAAASGKRRRATPF